LKPFSLFRFLTGTLFTVLLGQSFAETPAADPDAFSIVPHGFAGVQSFRLNKYKYLGQELGSYIYNNSVLNFTFDLESGKHLSIRSGMEGYVTFSSVAYNKLNNPGATATADPLWSWYMAQAEMAYSFGESGDAFHGDIGVGLFPYKYNPEARNLGEYMFRSGTYPGWLTTTFDWTATRLTGLRFSSTLFDKWHNDVMLTTEMEMYPLFDLSLSWITDFQLGKALDIGGGVDFARFLPANGDLTTPKGSEYGIIGKDRPNFYMDGADTVNYTFTGIKLMGRATLDPKALFGVQTTEKAMTLGKEDLKIFGEVAVLGLKNQGTVYDKVLQRMPVMAGINIPTFNLLDVLAFQVEYYANPYPIDNYWQIQFSTKGIPQPTEGDGCCSDPTSKYTIANPVFGRENYYIEDNWKWSLYARRWLGKHLALVGQVARDHWKANIPYSNSRDTEDALVTPQHWYTALKIVSVW
jgi:hypothetical protein